MRQFRFAQKAFIVDNGKLLLVKKSKDDPYHPGEWEVPGGGGEECNLGRNRRNISNGK